MKKRDVRSSGSAGIAMLLTAILLPSGAQAAAAPGALAGQSPASIQISDSVAPRVHLTQDAGERLLRQDPSKEGPLIAACTRYTIVRSPDEASEAAPSGAPRTPELLLVVPD